MPTAVLHHIVRYILGNGFRHETYMENGRAHCYRSGRMRVVIDDSVTIFVSDNDGNVQWSARYCHAPLSVVTRAIDAARGSADVTAMT